MKDLTIRGWDGTKMLLKGDMTNLPLMVYIGIVDRNNTKIFEEDIVKILAGKKNDGYKVGFYCGAFCFVGAQVGICSFIKLRDELLEGLVTGNKEVAPLSSFLEVIGNTFEGVRYNAPSGGIRL